MNTAKARQDTVDTLKRLTPLTVRRGLVRGRLTVRIGTAALRELPDFVILGGQRCGTSSMYKYLSRHPQIVPSLRKETEYFTINYDKGEEWYRAHFPLRIRRRSAQLRGKRQFSFEATPDYLFDPRAPQRLTETLPGAKLVVMLRDPVERAFSHYHHNIRLGLEDLSFRDAIAAEEERIAPDLEVMRDNPFDRVVNYRRYSYVSRGDYGTQIGRWLDLFDRDRILFISAEDFFEHPEGALHSLERFVGAEIWSPPDFVNYSYTGIAVAEHPELPLDLRRELELRFASSHSDIERLTGLSVPWDYDL
ncbi:MAG: sulfotransferase domain-containing protein [Actinomycetota bacterium]